MTTVHWESGEWVSSWLSHCVTVAKSLPLGLITPDKMSMVDIPSSDILGKTWQTTQSSIESDAKLRGDCKRLTKLRGAGSCHKGLG